MQYNVEGYCFWLEDYFTVTNPNPREYIHKYKDLIHDRIVFVRRGPNIPLVTKVSFLQYAGAIAVVIVDENNCEKFNQSCFPGSDKSFRHGFNRLDIKSKDWHAIKIPVVFMLNIDAKHIANLGDCEGFLREEDINETLDNMSHDEL